MPALSIALALLSIAAAATKTFANDTTRIKESAAISAAESKRAISKEKKESKGAIVYPALLEDDADRMLDYMEKFSEKRRGYLMRMYGKSKKYFPKVQSILKKYDVPTEFAVLLALESAFNANAVSRAGAVGYWQIMDDVAKEYGLKIVEDQHLAKTPKKIKQQGKATTHNKKTKTKPVIDERKNFVKATHTAAKYLRARMKNLNNNYLLVAASYNWGVGNVWQAMAASGKKNPSYWDISHKMPAETRAYVMNFITLNVIFKNYQQFEKGGLCFR